MSERQRLRNTALRMIVTINASLGPFADSVASTRTEESDMVAEWRKHPIITVCEDTEGRQFVVGRTEPSPDPSSDLEPITFLIKLSGDTCGQDPANTTVDGRGE